MFLSKALSQRSLSLCFLSAFSLVIKTFGQSFANNFSKNNMGRREHVTAIRQFIHKSKLCPRLAAYACHQERRISRHESHANLQCRACHLNQMSLQLKTNRKSRDVNDHRIVKRCRFCRHKSTMKLTKLPGRPNRRITNSKVSESRQKSEEKKPVVKPIVKKSKAVPPKKTLTSVAMDNLQKLMAAKKSSFKKSGLLDLLAKKT